MVLAIDTSCDETAAAITKGRRVLANSLYSQAIIHSKWGGVVPSLAKRAHQEKIDWVINNLKINKKPIDFNLIEAVAVTIGPGLAVALEVGIKKAKEIAIKYKKKLIAVNHLDGHLYSPFVQNSQGKPSNNFQFPYLGLIVSGGHTLLTIFKDHLEYQILGETLDDAAGEALDKAAKLMGLGYPGGPVIEKLSQEVDNKDFYKLPRPMLRQGGLNFSFSGLKTAFYYFYQKLPDSEKTRKIRELASSFQQAVFATLIKKAELAIKETGIRKVLVVGGVAANFYLRQLFRRLLKKIKGQVLFPSFKYLNGDNAAMIGVAGHYYLKHGFVVRDYDLLDRKPRLALGDFSFLR